MKNCKKCCETKPLSEFYKSKQSKDGVRTYCIRCMKKDQSEWVANNPIERKVQYTRHNNKIETKNKAKLRPITPYSPEHYQQNKVRIRGSARKYSKLNPDKIKELQARYRANKLNASINYKEYKSQLIEIYRGCPPGMHVDHIVPLQGKRVCGLHVPWNLQYLSKSENLKKGNRYE